MQQELVANRIKHAIDAVKKSMEETEQAHQQFTVALTAALRLLSGTGSSTLAGLHGTPDNVQGFLVEQASGLQDITSRQLAALKEMLEKLLKEVVSAT